MGGNYKITSGGVVTEAAGLAAVGNGHPVEVFNTANTGINTSGAHTTSMVTPATNGLYQFSAYLLQTDTGSVCTGSGNTATVTLTYTDAATGSNYTASLNLELGSGANSGNGLTFVTSSLGVNQSAVVRSHLIYASSAGAISYTVTYNQNESCTTQPKMAIYPLLEAM